MLGSAFLAIGLTMKIMAAIFLICAVVLVLVILVQKGRGGGLGAAFGGGAGSVLGSKTGDFLTWLTVILFGLFLTLAVLMDKFYRPSISDFGTGQDIRREQPAPGQETLPTEDSPFETSDTDRDVNSIGG